MGKNTGVDRGGVVIDLAVGLAILEHVVQLEKTPVSLAAARASPAKHLKNSKPDTQASFFCKAGSAGTANGSRSMCAAICAEGLFGEIFITAAALV
jgi:hypothetical protein